MKGNRQEQHDDRFAAASALWEQGHLRRAFRLFLLAAKAGDASCQLNVGYFYDEGIGMKANPAKALLWYRKAYRAGDPSAANNIGIMLGQQGKSRRSVAWLERALEAGNDDSALDLARHYLKRGDKRRARRYLRVAARSRRVCEATQEEAEELLRNLHSCDRQKEKSFLGSEQGEGAMGLLDKTNPKATRQSLAKHAALGALIGVGCYGLLLHKGDGGILPFLAFVVLGAFASGLLEWQMGPDED